jgi:concanavalin A-like lectin/glucanase superfamily protein
MMAMLHHRSTRIGFAGLGAASLLNGCSLLFNLDGLTDDVGAGSSGSRGIIDSGPETTEARSHETDGSIDSAIEAAESLPEVGVDSSDVSLNEATFDEGADSQTPDSRPEGSPPAEASVYEIGGRLAGLTPGEVITLQDNLGDNLTLSSNGAFSFPTAMVGGASYAVTILTNPATPIAQTCSVSNANGTVRDTPVTTVEVDCDLLAYFPFGGNANDASGYGHDGIVVGARLTTDRDGKADSAYAFAGTGNIQAAMPVGFLPSSDEARTLTAWLEPTQSTSLPGLVYWGTGNCTGLMFGLGVYIGAANFWGGCDDYDSGLPLQLSTWSFLAIVYSPTIPTTMTFYVNNLSVTGTVTTLATGDGAPLVMGADLMTGASLTGSLGAIRVYGRALGAAEIRSIFMSSTP